MRSGLSLHLAHVTAGSTSDSRKFLSSLDTMDSPRNVNRDVESDEVPSSIFYNYPAARNGPPGRWAHSACAIGNQLIVFGGIGESCLIFVRLVFA